MFADLAGELSTQSLLLEPSAGLRHPEAASSGQISERPDLVAYYAVTRFVHEPDVRTSQRDAAVARRGELSCGHLEILRSPLTTQVRVSGLCAARHPSLVTGALKEF